MGASRPKKLKKKLKKRAASRRQKAKKRVFNFFILIKKNPGRYQLSSSSYSPRSSYSPLVSADP